MTMDKSKRVMIRSQLYRYCPLYAQKGSHDFKSCLHTLQGKRYMVTFITSHHKHKVSLQHSVTFSTDTIEGTNW